MRTELFAAFMVAFAAPALAGATYGTPVACEFVLGGGDPESLPGGLAGEEESYFFNQIVYVGPEFICDVGPSTCYTGGDEGWQASISADVTATEAVIRVDEADPVRLQSCP